MKYIQTCQVYSGYHAHLDIFKFIWTILTQTSQILAFIWTVSPLSVMKNRPQIFQELIPYILAYKQNFLHQKMRLTQGRHLICDYRNVQKWTDIKLLIFGEVQGVVLYVRSTYSRVYVVLQENIKYRKCRFLFLIITIRQHGFAKNQSCTHRDCRIQKCYIKQ